MFGQNNQPQQDNAQIPEQSIDGVIADANQPATIQPVSWQHPGNPLPNTADPQPNPTITASVPADLPTVPPSPASPSDNDAVTHDLADIKQQALNQLSPLVGHLDQSPEDTFRTTMMMIQASDDQSLVKTAYEAAQKIEDEKVRAQALLDIVNEINYFTQHHQE